MSDTTIRVRFAETDQMGIAHHSAYVVWCEAGRVEWLRQRGLSYRDMEDEGTSLAVSHVELDYRAAARFDDELAVATRLEEARSRRVAFRYRITRLSDGALVATARSEHVPTDTNGHAVRLPERWLEPLRRLLATDP